MVVRPRTHEQGRRSRPCRQQAGGTPTHSRAATAANLAIMTGPATQIRRNPNRPISGALTCGCALATPGAERVCAPRERRQRAASRSTLQALGAKFVAGDDRACRCACGELGRDAARRQRRSPTLPPLSESTAAFLRAARVRLVVRPRRCREPLGPADRLCRWSRRHRAPSRSLRGAGKEPDDRPIVPVDSNQAASIQRDPDGHAAERFVFFLPVPRVRSAHARSSAVRSPPVWLKA